MSAEWAVVPVEPHLGMCSAGRNAAELPLIADARKCISAAIAARPTGPDVPLLIDASELAALRRGAEVHRQRAEHAEACYQRAARVLTHIHALLHPPVVTTPDGRTFSFKSPMLDQQIQELSDRIRAIPDELAALAQEKAK